MATRPNRNYKHLGDLELEDMLQIDLVSARGWKTKYVGLKDGLLYVFRKRAQHNKAGQSIVVYSLDRSKVFHGPKTKNGYEFYISLYDSSFVREIERVALAADEPSTMFHWVDALKSLGSNPHVQMPRAPGAPLKLKMRGCYHGLETHITRVVEALPAVGRVQVDTDNNTLELWAAPGSKCQEQEAIDQLATLGILSGPESVDQTILSKL